MATPLIQTAIVTGEVSPSLFGRIDIDRERVAASTLRNMFVSYRGGAASRAGTKFVGFSKQTGRDFPPRLIPFQFSTNQGLVLEFGQRFMRVVNEGGFVVESPVAIGAVTQANPAVLTFGTQGAASGTPNDGAVTFSYAPGDFVTLDGGVFLTPAVLLVATSQLVSLLPDANGNGYAIGDTVTMAGGTFSAAAVATVASLVSTEATGNIVFAVNPSDGDTITLNGVTWTFKTTVSAPAETGIQPTLGQTLVQLVSDLNASVDAGLTVATYSADTTTLTVLYDTPGLGGNAYTLAASVATPSGGTLAGGSTTGIGTLNVTTPGVYSALPLNALLTESATSGGGTGASFQTAVFGPHAVAVANPGAYTAVPANPVAQASTTGIGLGATFTMAWAAIAPFSNGDWVAISGAAGMTQLNGNTYRLGGVTATTAQLFDIYGNPINSAGYGAYTGGGIASRIFTLTTIYDEQDLKWLKFIQSADVMTLCCVNPETGTEYPPQDLGRFSDTDWVFTPVVPQSTIDPPTTVSASITGGGGNAFYQYQVTAVSPIDGTESVASDIAEIDNGIDISTTKGTISVRWSQVSDVESYNIYKASPAFNVHIPTGVQFGYAGSAYGGRWTDSNVIPDFSQVPPTHKNPFARGQVVGAKVVTGGTGYTTCTATINTATGTGAVLTPVVDLGVLVAIIVTDAGEGYDPADTITIGGAGTGATATLSVGPETGTYPAVPGYFQQRRVFANSLNQPDTYWMSQPGAFTNFDSRIPPIDTDAITGSPWAVQVNGIQFLVQTSGGLLVMTGQSSWTIVGAGSFATNVQAITPSSQNVTPQPFTGCSPYVPPIKINYEVIYVSQKGSLYYDLPVQAIAPSEPIDLTEYSTHLFIGHTVREHAWCEQPNKLMWSVRDDGTMLSLTFLKAEQIAGWARHDTDGQFESVCSITEPPVDALYLAVQRFPGTETAYMIERMDNRIWSAVEDTWAVDCGLRFPQPTPNATLTCDLPNGLGAISGTTGLVGGENYSSSTVVTIEDAQQNGGGSGATATATVVGGVVTGIAIVTPGSGYINPTMTISDPESVGTGASVQAILDTSATFTADGSVFGGGDVGKVIRMGGGIATITAVPTGNTVTATISTPITALRPNSGGEVMPQVTGTWTMTRPITTVGGLEHLAGAIVTGLVDGNVMTPRVVSASGTVTLDAPASSITIGLGFQAQMQSVYADAGAPTMQGQRKKIGAVSALMEASRDIQVGANQPDGSTFNPPIIDPPWVDMTTFENLVKPAYNSTVAPLFTGYVRAPVQQDLAIPGQVAFEQNFPLPMTILALVSEVLPGDTPDNMIKGSGQQQ